MKLLKHWPSQFHWEFWLGGHLAYKERLQQNIKAVRSRIINSCGTSSIEIAFPEESNLDIDMTLQFETLYNDERIFRVFPLLKEYGLFSFEADLQASSENELWDAYVAYYEYDPARWTGIKRTYISCVECEELLRRLNPEDIYTVFDAVLWMRCSNRIKDIGGTAYVDFYNRSVINKQPVLPVLQEREDD